MKQILLVDTTGNVWGTVWRICILMLRCEWVNGVKGTYNMRYNFQVGKLADLVLWNPALFGSKPEIVVKGGQIAWSQMGKKGNAYC